MRAKFFFNGVMNEFIKPTAHSTAVVVSSTVIGIGLTEAAMSAKNYVEKNFQSHETDPFTETNNPSLFNTHS